MAKKILIMSAVLILSAGLARAAEGGAPRSVTIAAAATRFIVEPATGTEMVSVKGGCYKMGDASRETGPEEKPVHEVCVDDYYIGKYEVTQGEWKKIMGNNPSVSSGCGDSCPVDNVNWQDAQEFIAKLNATSPLVKKSSIVYRLPTEAEWEYAARSGGSRETYAGGDDVEAVAWFNLNAEAIHPVGTKAPNGLDLFDMSGNVSEWTNDWYGVTFYATSPRNNPKGPASGDRRVVRGGCFGDYPFDLRTSYRNYLPPDFRGEGKGFRLAGSIPAKVK